MIVYAAHRTEDGRIQSVKEHLENTARLCREYAIDELKDCAYLCGLLHDIGKYTHSFQKYINGDTSARVEHARYGAQEVSKNKSWYVPMLEYCIAGHHTGLPDGGAKNALPESPTLRGLMKRETEDYSEFYREISASYPNNTFLRIFFCDDRTEFTERYAFFTKYMFSCLTDADFIDTESFFTPDTDRKITGDFKSAYERVRERLNSFVPITEVQRTRRFLQAQVYESVKDDAEVYLIDMPTGSGKTLCSIKAALEKVITGDKKRIIYVIPYVSIIEQTANIFRDIFGDVLPVLEHHSNYDFDNEDKNEQLTADKLKRCCENWDAPFIVTTNIQFFESLYHHKSSRLRKLHNLADSVIVFDEVHMLPTKYIQPCLRAIGYVTKYLHAAALLMSATMPDYTELFGKYMKQNRFVTAVNDKTTFGVFKRCRYTYISKCSIETIAEKTVMEDNALIIVNKRRTARELYKLCKSAGIGNVYHLSTYMTPAHRSEVIEQIHEDLSEGIKTTVVSTSLVEAGVDLDFAAVFRENAGLDNIIQSGGRCNREGRLEKGEVYVFETGGDRGEIRMKANITRKLFEEYEDISSEECVKEYYRRLLKSDESVIDKNSITAFMGDCPNCSEIPFREYSESFSFISNETIGIVIPDESNKELIEKLRFGAVSVKRQLQKYCASVRGHEFKTLAETGIIEKTEGGVFILSNPDYYDNEIGLDIEKELNYML